jgi:hypothetical protein
MTYLLLTLDRRITTMIKSCVTIGTDPEFALRKANGDWVSAIPLIPGTKDKPLQLANGSWLQHDNVALEFAVTPSQYLEEFKRKIKDTLELATMYLPNDVDIVAVPSADFPENELDHPEAREFGCDPDYNAWTGGVNKFDEDAPNRPLRSFGGHIHIGATDKYHWLKYPAEARMFVRWLDVMLGLPSMIIDNSPAARNRRELYGKAGAYRLPAHGVEYRTLSNFWLKDMDRIELFFRLTSEAVEYYHKYDTKGLVNYILPDEIINEVFVGDAQGFFTEIRKHNVIKKVTWELFKECAEKAGENEETTLNETWDLRRAA